MVHSAHAMMLTPDEVASVLRCHRHTIYRRIKAGDIPAIRVFNKLLVKREAIDMLIDQGQHMSEVRN